MGDEVNPTVIKTTQGCLGKYVKKPPLTEKLLGRPPFKYLHDIFSAVIKSNGFMEGLFTTTEMNAESFKDRDSKTAYLDKVIRMVGLVNGKEVDAKPSAIIAGKEAEKTNIFLQELATALGKKINNAEYVQRVMKGEGPQSKKPREESKDRRDEGKDKRKDERESSKERRDDSKEKPREENKDKRKDERESSKDKRDDNKEKPREESKDRRKDDRESSKDKREGSKERSKDDRDDKDKKREEASRDRRAKDEEKDQVEKEKERQKEAGDSKSRDRGRGEKDEDKDRRRGRADDKRRPSDSQQPADDGNQKGSKDDEGSPNRIPRPSSAKGNRRLRDGRRAHNDADSEEELQRKQKSDADEPGGGARAPSAKPAPRVKAAPGATPGVVDDGSGKRVTGVIIERDQDSDDDQFVVEEAPPTLLAGGFNDNGGGGLEDEDEAQEEQHGGLVKEMLKSKQEFKDTGKEAGAGGKTVLTTTDANRRKEKAATTREIDRLKQQLQSLTREANPLGKVIDFVQEDLDSMAKELERWRAETKEVMGRLKQEQSSADASLNGLRHQLAELEQAEKDKLDLIATVKANIVRNDERIAKMIEAMSRS